MAIVSIKTLLERHNLATPRQFDDWNKAWRRGRRGRLAGDRCWRSSRGKRADSRRFSSRRWPRRLGWPFIDLAKTEVPLEARKRISTKVAFQYFVLPVAVREGPTAGRGEQPLRRRDAQRGAVRRPGAGAIRADDADGDREIAQEVLRGRGGNAGRDRQGRRALEVLAETKEITEGDQEASVIKFVNQIIWEAFKDRATDIHFEPAEDELRIRYRIDGILHQTPMPPQLKRFQASLISRIKVMSGHEHRREAPAAGRPHQRAHQGGGN